MDTIIDMLIIGAGPGGISMATEAINSGITSQNIKIIEKEKAHSWSIRKFYPEKKLVTANYKGENAVCFGVMCISDTSKEDTLSYLDKAIDKYQIQVNYNESIHKIERQENEKTTYFKIESNLSVYLAKTCVIAIGIMGRPNKPSFKIPSLIRSKVHHDVSFTSENQENILVVGGGDTASEYAQYLIEKGHKVTLSYRKSHFSRLNTINKESLEALISQNKIKILLESNILEIQKNSEKENILVQFQEKEIEDKIFDRLILAIGGSTPLNFLSSVGIEFKGNSPFLREGYETSIPGLFLIGDLSAGKKGGSIISAFTSSHHAMEKICTSYLECAKS